MRWWPTRKLRKGTLTLTGAGSAVSLSPPVITSALTAQAIVGVAFTYQITATNSPTSFGAAPLPAGLSVNTSTGVISGTPTGAGGNTNVTISATNSAGTGQATLVLSVFDPSQLTGLDAWYKSDVGLVTDGAASLLSSGTQYLWTSTSPINYSTCGDFFISCWVNQATLPAEADILSNSYSTGWLVTSISGQIRFYSGGAGTSISSTTITANTWHHIFAWYRSSTQTWYLRVDNGTITSGNVNITPGNGLHILLGVVETNSTSNPFNGNVDAVVLGATPTSDIGDGTAGSLAAQISTALNNSGNGLAAKDITSTQKTSWGVVSGWDFDGYANLTKDYVGSTTLTNVGPATYVAGKVSTNTLVDGDCVAKWKDQSSNGNDLVQATGPNRPTYKVNQQNGRALVEFSLVASPYAHNFLRSIFGAAIAQPYSFFVAAKELSPAADPSPIFSGYVGTGGAQFTVRSANFDMECSQSGGNIAVRASDTNFHIFGGDWNGASSQFRFDGGSYATVSASPGTDTQGGITVGSTGQASPATFGFCAVGELVFCNPIPNAANKTNMFSYLDARWAVY